MKQAHTLCSSITTKAEQREAAYIEAIRTSLNRIIGPGLLSREDINRQISELLEQSIHSEGVINLFQDFDKGFSIFDPIFIEKIRRMEQKNLSKELLKKLIQDEIEVFHRGDIVKGREFSERLKSIMKRYKEGMLANAESLDRFVGFSVGDTGDYNVTSVRDMLLDLAKDIVRLDEENKALGLTREELTFYHAIIKPENISDFYTNEELIELTQALTEAINEEMTSDWMKRESGIANMKRKVKRLLHKYKYPQDQRDKIIDLIVEQAEYYEDGIIGA